MICKMLNYKLMNSAIQQKLTKKERMKCPQIKAEKGLSEFKSPMEDVMFKDFPKEATTYIYYGERDESGDIIKWLKNELKDIK